VGQGGRGAAPKGCHLKVEDPSLRERDLFSAGHLLIATFPWANRNISRDWVEQLKW
jgi:hypothetical protein